MASRPKARILVAEDFPGLASVVRFNLEHVGYSVFVALDGEQAWEAAQRECFDLILTDEMMPRLTGRELCQRLRQDPRYAETPIIFLTAKKLELDLRDLKLAKVIGKPFSLALLVQTVDETLRERAVNPPPIESPSGT